MIRRALITLAAATLPVVGLTAPAHAAGWVANSCAVSQALHAVRDEPHPVTGNGLTVQFVPCGQGASGIRYVTAGRYPFFVNPEGPMPPFCMQAGQKYFPQPSGAVITPTVRCR